MVVVGVVEIVAGLVVFMRPRFGGYLVAAWLLGIIGNLLLIPGYRDDVGDRAFTVPRLSASEDFSRIPDAFGVPYTYWGLGGIDPEQWRRAEAAGTLATDIPANHSPRFAPVIQPTLETGTAAIVVAALAWLSS